MDPMDLLSSSAKRLDAVYSERDRVVALAAVLATLAGYHAWVGRVNDATPGFTHAVYIDLPTGQVSWHITDAELPLVSMLPYETGTWKREPGDKYGAINSFTHFVLPDRRE